MEINYENRSFSTYIEFMRRFSGNWVVQDITTQKDSLFIIYRIIPLYKYDVNIENDSVKLYRR